MRIKKESGGAWSLMFMIVISCITQVATLMKSSIVAGTFGATEAMDAYHFANSILSFVFGLVASGVPTIIIPAYVNERDRKGIDSFITLLYGALLVLVAGIVLLRYQIVYTFTNRSEMFANIACDALLILAFFQYLSAFTGITTAYFQNKEKPNIPKLINLASQIVVVVCLAINPNVDIYTYILVISSGILINFVLDTMVALKEGWRYVPRLSLHNPVSKELLERFWPVLFSSSVYKLSLFVDSMIAANLEEGKLSVLNYSNQIVSMVNSLIIGNILIYAYPKLIKKLSGGKNQDYLWRQTALYHMIVCLLIVGFFTVGEDGVTLLFQRGEFDATATRSVFFGALLYIFGQQFNIIRDLVYRYFYCIGNTKIPAQNSVFVSIFNIVASLILVQFMGLYGIILGTVIASLSSTAMILLRFHKTVKLSPDFKKTLFAFAKSITAMVCTAALVYLTKTVLPVENLILRILLFGAETVAVYGAIVYLVNREALRAIKE